jgi:two-component system, OmpR family, response regulator RegX3
VARARRILIVEDDAKTAASVDIYLRHDGFRTELARSGTEALHKARDGKPDLIVLDLMLPGLGGIELCRTLRAESAVPIIMLTARGTETDRVVGLELGADDYVTKPYSSRELIARIRAMLRRSAQPDAGGSGNILTAGPVQMDLDKHTLTVAGVVTAMPLKEFELLELLLRNAGRVLTRGQLMDRVWGSDYSGDTKTLDVHVKRIRSRIEANPSEPTMLITVRGLGYRFDA